MSDEDARPGIIMPRQLRSTFNEYRRIVPLVGTSRDRKARDMSDLDTREWRVGQHYGVHVYAVNPDGDDDPIASFLGDRETAERMAAQMVAEHAMLCAPYADDQHRGGHWLDVLPQRPRWAQ